MPTNQPASPIVIYDTPPPAGTELEDRGFRYKVLASRKHRNQKGEISCLITWEGTCAEGGEPFTFKTGGRIYAMRRRCKDHNMGWTKAVPYGQAKPYAASPHEYVEQVLARMEARGAVLDDTTDLDPYRWPVKIMRAFLAFEAGEMSREELRALESGE